VSSLLPAAPELGLFMAAVLVLNATPGVDFLLTVTRTLAGGPRAGLAAALGIGAGCVVHALAAAFGLAALLALHPAAFAALQWAGATYLVWLGLGLLRQAWRGRPAAAAQTAAAARSVAADFRAGLLTNLLNPKVGFFFLAFLPQFIAAQAPGKTAAFLALGALFVLQSMVFLALLVMVAAQLRGLNTPPAVRRVWSAAAGVLFIVLAARLLGSRAAPG